MSFDNFSEAIRKSLEWPGVKEELIERTTLDNMDSEEDSQMDSLPAAINGQHKSICKKAIATDTIDLVLLGSKSCKNCHNRQIEVVPVCTVAVDTSDLEAHYEFYRHSLTKFSKTVSTDTQDLDSYKPKLFASIAVGPDYQNSECEDADSKPPLTSVTFKKVRVKEEKVEIEDISKEEIEIPFPVEVSHSLDTGSDSDDRPLRPRKLRSTTKRRARVKKNSKKETSKRAKRKTKYISYEVEKVCNDAENTIESSPKLSNKLAIRKIVKQSSTEDTKLKSEDESNSSNNEADAFSDGFFAQDDNFDSAPDDSGKPSISKTEEQKKPARRMRIKRFECLTCGKRFHGRNDLRDHETVHTGVRDYACEICKKSFTTKTILKAHEIVHTDLQPFQCEICHKKFRRNDSLRAHMRQHNNDRPFKCDLCPLAFTRMFTLKNHRVTHSGEKAHICPHCGKGFATRGGLGTHERTRHNPELADKPRKPYTRRERDFTPCVCDQCGKVYSNQSNLRIHKYVHSGERNFSCAVCGMAFATKYTLQCHARKHTNERPFVCETCGQTFYRNSTLKTHKLKHTGEKPHPCPLCGKCFRQRCSLRYHLMHHDRVPRQANPNSKKRRKKRPNSGGPSLPPPPQQHHHGQLPPTMQILHGAEQHVIGHATPPLSMYAPPPVGLAMAISSGELAHEMGQQNSNLVQLL